MAQGGDEAQMPDLSRELAQGFLARFVREYCTGKGNLWVGNGQFEDEAGKVWPCGFVAVRHGRRVAWARCVGLAGPNTEWLLGRMAGYAA